MAIFSSPQKRIERLGARPERPLTPEEVSFRDYSQIENLHQAGPIARADFTLINEGALKKLRENLDAVLKKIIPSPGA